MLRELQSLLIIFAIAAPACFAQATNSTAVTGDRRHTSNYTGSGPQGMGGESSGQTSQQSTCFLPTGFGQLAPSVGGGRLPKTTLDSFVKQAAGSAELIYGDEGANGLPPYENFTADHRIIAGINSSGLTTKHGSELPCAWGGDEFIGAEWSNSGPSGGGSSAGRGFGGGGSSSSMSSGSTGGGNGGGSGIGPGGIGGISFPFNPGFQFSGNGNGQIPQFPFDGTPGF